MVAGTTLVIPVLFCIVATSIFFTFGFGHLRDAGRLRWLGIQPIDRAEEYRQNVARLNLMRARLGWDALDPDIDIDSNPPKIPLLEEVEIVQRDQQEDVQWRPLCVVNSRVRTKEQVEISFIIVEPQPIPPTRSSPDLHNLTKPSPLRSSPASQPNLSNLTQPPSDGRLLESDYIPGMDFGTVRLDVSGGKLES